MMTADQKIEKQIYGMTIAEVREEIENSVYFSVMKDVDMLVMSMLSDAQEMVNYDRSDENLNLQRQLINRAKYALRYYVMDKEAA